MSDNPGDNFDNSPAAVPSQSEDTAKVATSPIKPGMGAMEQVRLLTRRVDDLMELLRTQREILRQKGMNLPPGSLDSLKMLRTRLDALGKQLTNTQIELKQLRALAETTALINSSLDPSDVLNQVMDTVIQLTGAERGYIMLKNKETGEMTDFAVARGIDQEQLAQSDFTVSRTVVNEVASKGEYVLTDNAQADERLKGGASIANLKLLSILAVPLKVRDNVIGVVYCDNRIMAGLFTKHEVGLLVAFANQAAVAIENARLFESARVNLEQVTQLRDLMNNIFTSITSGIISVDPRDIVMTFNAAAGAILGVEGDPHGYRLQQVVTGMPKEFFDALAQVRSTGVQQVLELNPVLDGRGERFWIIIISPLRDARGVSQGVVLVLDDLTEQKAREAQLAEVRRYLPTALVDNIRSVDDVNVGGQEREITAIFADVRGFTSFSENLEPEELMQIINKYLSVASDGINLFEGIVDKYMGDAVTGLFNTQLNPQDNHAERAVRAAMSVIYDLYALHEVLPDPAQHLYFGIGIHTGTAVLGNVGSPERKEFASMGEANDVCKLLQENAGKGEIVISEATYERVQHLFECEQFEVPEEKRKGRTDIATAYKVKKLKKNPAAALAFDPELADLLNDLKND